uniref:Uncharacterized protein n=1 Tax=Arundo donax TaxID=35708 RepID=A0A0A9ACT3_ARUDO
MHDHNICFFLSKQLAPLFTKFKAFTMNVVSLF